MFSVVVLR